MAVEYYNLDTKSTSVEFIGRNIRTAASNKLFYFSGAGDINSRGVTQRRANFISTLVGQEKSLINNLDVILPRVPDCKEDNPEEYMPPLFCNDVFKPIIERSKKLVNRDDQLAFIKLELSKITLVGFSRGCLIISNISKQLGEDLEADGFNEEEISEIKSSLFSCLIGPKVHFAFIDKELPGFTFVSDNDSVSAYYNRRIWEPGFEHHSVISHNTQGANTLVLSHGIENRVRSARYRRDDDEIYKWEGEEECFESNNRFFRDRVVQDGHSPINYTNITGEFFDGDIVTFQSNTSAPLIRESIERAVKAGLDANIDSPRDSLSLNNGLAQDYLSEDAKNHAARLQKISDKAYTAMTGR